MDIFYRPADGWAGDFIPFYWDGEYHLFYLKAYRDRPMSGEPLPWFHVATRDFVSFTDRGLALPPGTRTDLDRQLLTGSVIERDGVFHMFPGGLNQSLFESGGPGQVVLHATSTDLVTWTKDQGFALHPDLSRYEKEDWRDALVFWNEEAGEYWMLVTARLDHGPSDRRGCIALCASRDLIHWEHREPFWTSWSDLSQEVPDLFRMGDWWYLAYSTIGDERLTKYRISKSLAGPWLAPVIDTFDGRGWSAGKTATDGNERYAFGWAASKLGPADDGARQWAGSLVVHRLLRRSDGTLSVCPPPAVDAALASPVPLDPHPVLGDWTITPNALATDATGMTAWCRLVEMPDRCKVVTTIDLTSGAREAGLLLRADEATGDCYFLRLEPARNRIVFDRRVRPRPTEGTTIERHVDLSGGEARLKVFVEGSVLVAYVNDEVALTARGYDYRDGTVAVFAADGAATFTGTGVFVA